MKSIANVIVLCMSCKKCIPYMFIITLILRSNLKSETPAIMFERVKFIFYKPTDQGINAN